MTEEKGALEEYIKKGLERGFNINYIKETLVKHGHSKGQVETSANNIMGLKYPEKLKPHLEEESGSSKRPKYKFVVIILIIIILLITSIFVYSYISNRTNITMVKSKLAEIQELGGDIDDLSSELKTQTELIKEKDLTIEEKEKIIEDQIKLIDEINGKIETQRTRLKQLLLDIMNRMIGRMSE